MANIKISELPVATVVNDADVVVLNQAGVTKQAARSLVNAPTGTLPVANGGTGVTVSSGANSVVLRDASQNITANRIVEGFSSIVASGVQVILTVASAPSYLVTGSGGQTIKLPDATTLQKGVIYRLNNNQSSGAINVNNNSNTLVASIPSGGFTEVALLDNATAAGSWERHEQAPANVSWSTNTLDYPGSITSATWNGNAVAVNRGGTGAATLTGLVKGNGTSAFTAATAGTDYVIPSGNITGTASNVTGTVAVANGGTGVTTQQAAINALAGATTSAQFLRGNGTNVSMSAIQAGDVPILNQNTTGTAANVTGTVAVANGGSGQTSYTDGQLLIGNTTGNTLAKATLTAGSNVTITNGPGTITIDATGAGGVSSFNAGTTGLTPNTATTGAVTLAGTLAVANGGTGATNAQAAISSLGVGMRMVEAQTNGSITGTMVGNVFTVTAAGVFTTDGYTPVLGDIIAFALQGGGTSVQNGFWEVTTVGTASVSAVFTRPSWFTGTARNGMYMTRFGATQSGYVMAFFGPGGNSDITVGTSTIQVVRASQRLANATQSINLFTGYQTFRASGASANQAPFFFQAGAALMTATQAHAIEWFNDTLFLTTAAGVRTINPSFINGAAGGGTVPATNTTTGIVGQMAFDATGLYVCTATNTWKRVAWTAF